MEKINSKPEKHIEYTFQSKAVSDRLEVSVFDSDQVLFMNLKFEIILIFIVIMNMLKLLLLLMIVVTATGQSYLIKDLWYRKIIPVTVPECSSYPVYYADLLNLDAYACINNNGTYHKLGIKTSEMT